jgi:hypothetical protein
VELFILVELQATVAVQAEKLTYWVAVSAVVPGVLVEGDMSNASA